MVIQTDLKAGIPMDIQTGPQTAHRRAFKQGGKTSKHPDSSTDRHPDWPQTGISRAFQSYNTDIQKGLRTSLTISIWIFRQTSSQISR